MTFKLKIIILIKHNYLSNSIVVIIIKIVIIVNYYSNSPNLDKIWNDLKIQNVKGFI